MNSLSNNLVTRSFRASLVIALQIILLTACGVLADGRDRWQKPDEVIKALGLKPGMVVVDIGAGEGYFTWRFAVAVGPEGKAIGAEISRSDVRKMTADAKRLGLSNYEAKLVPSDDPQLDPRSVDVIFLCDTYHHIENRVSYFTRVKEALRADGRLAIIDYPEDGTAHSIKKQTVIDELKQAGFAVAEDHSALLPRQFFLTFKTVEQGGTETMIDESADSHSLARSKEREVWITSHDGFKLRGVYHSAEKQGPGILLLHQCDREGMATGYETIARMLFDRGFHVLTLDFRGYGKSVDAAYNRDNWQAAGPHFSRDVDAAYRFLISQSGVEKSAIGVVGASCGGRQSILLAAAYAEIKALVFISSSIGGPSAMAYQKLTHLPVLAIASENDPFGATTQSMRQVFEQSKHEDSKLLVYKGNEHGTPLFAKDRHLEGVITEWLQARLMK